MKGGKAESKENKRKKVLLEGNSVGTPKADISKLKIPSWYDEKKFNRAKELYKDNMASIIFAHFCGLIMCFYFPKNTKTFMFTGESSSINKLFHRYLTTTRYVQKWYEGNVWDENDSAHRILSMVRSMHARVSKNMAALNDGEIYISQWDMAVTQWSFVGPIVLFPKLVGLHGWTNDDYDAIIHFWRTIGYILGTEDRYNLCEGSYNEVIKTCEKMLHDDYKPMVENADPMSVDMAKNVTEAMSRIEPTYTWPAVATYIYELVGLPCPVDMGIIDNICYSLLHFTMTYLVKFGTIRALLNKVVRWRLSSAEKADLQLIEKGKRSVTDGKISN